MRCAHGRINLVFQLLFQLRRVEFRRECTTIRVKMLKRPTLVRACSSPSLIYSPLLSSSLPACLLFSSLFQREWTRRICRRIQRVFHPSLLRPLPAPPPMQHTPSRGSKDLVEGVCGGEGKSSSFLFFLPFASLHPRDTFTYISALVTLVEASFFRESSSRTRAALSNSLAQRVARCACVFKAHVIRMIVAPTAIGQFLKAYVPLKSRM